ncbi:2Fe-2S iron-sulfur cluster-binding protein [Actinoplanes sp. M2I2]|uniref:2Fe-2S iron-sulfur cluster-binding protein n=1 Tax=Actinoplanes sp. M2I2 TaxID=1734444 RepID=UPI002021D1A8|nr:2Fe-2S iron-sulfur cluster-binding protein [Actinoplanes sp. M2I2]
MPRVEMVVNGTRRDFDSHLPETLADALRRSPGLAVDLGCADGTCGACTVLLDGEATRSCLVFAVQCAGADVRVG